MARARRGRRASAAGLAGVVVMLVLPAAAAAIPCNQVQDALNNSSDGSVITIDEGAVCGTADLPFTLKPNTTVTLQGGGSGATLDGGGAEQILSGSNIETTTIRNLTFRNGFTGGGAAISIIGASTPTLEGLRFLNNDVGNDNGGAVFIGSQSGTGTITIRNSVFGDGTVVNANTADTGAGADIASSGAGLEITGSTFARNRAANKAGGLRLSADPAVPITMTDNLFSGNSARDAGGGALISSSASGSPTTATIARNTFSQNQLTPDSLDVFAGGAGLLVAMSNGASVVMQTDNRFEGNTIAPTSASTNFSPQGGGESLSGATLNSRGDRFTGNSLPAKGSGGSTSSQGAGLRLEGCISPTVTDRLENAVIAGNAADGDADGAGLYIGCTSGPIALELTSSTISGNLAGSDTAGIWGGATTPSTRRTRSSRGTRAGSTSSASTPAPSRTATPASRVPRTRARATSAPTRCW